MSEEALFGKMNRRAFVAGVGTTALVGTVLPAVAGVAATQTTTSGGLVEIAGRITDKLGRPEARAYVEIMHHRVRDWKPGASERGIEATAWDVPDWLGVWTDDDGVFGIHTWWSMDDAPAQIVDTSAPHAEVLFAVETAKGKRMKKNIWLSRNPNHVRLDPSDPAILTPVAWSARAETAQFVANFTV